MITPNIKMSILENADDSLKNVVSKLMDANDEKLSSSSFIKSVVLSLHHSIELYFKFMLLQQNSLLLYDIKNEKTLKCILEALRDIRKHKINDEDKLIDLENILLSNDKVMTTSYSAVVDMCAVIFEFSNKTTDVFQRLGKIRNSFYHFGFDKNSGIFETFALIIEVLKEILYNISEYFDEHDSYFNYDDYIDSFESFIEGINSFMNRHFISENKIKYDQFINYFSKNLVGSYEDMDITTTVSYGVFSNFEINYKKEDLLFEISMSLFGYSNAIVVTAIESDLLALIYDFDNETFYLYDFEDWNDYDSFELDNGKYWLKDKQNKKCRAYTIESKTFLLDYIKERLLLYKK